MPQVSKPTLQQTVASVLKTSSTPLDYPAKIISSFLAAPVQHYAWKTMPAMPSGNYNQVWKSNFDIPMPLVPNSMYAGPWVLKHPISGDDMVSNAMNNKFRAVRLWNEINPGFARAGIYKRGWVAPYIDSSRVPSDGEIALKLVDIYTATRRIIVDAATKGNFLVDKSSGKLVLVDVDLALKRRNSIASHNFGLTLNERFAQYWEDPTLQKTHPLTLEVTRNLLFLEEHIDAASIDLICNSKQLTLKSILEITWFRTQKKVLTSHIFTQIANLAEIGISITDTLREALLYKEQTPKVTDLNTSFFSVNPGLTTKVNPVTSFVP